MGQTAFHSYLEGLPEARREKLREKIQKALSGPEPDPRTTSLKDIESFREAADRIQKDATTTGVTTVTDLVAYSLEAPANFLAPFLAPIRTRLPRRTVGGNGIHYKRITAIDGSEATGLVAENTDTTPGSTAGRAGFMNMTEVNDSTLFATFGVDNYITQEAVYAGKSTLSQDFKPKEVSRLALMNAAMMREEKLLLGCNKTALTSAALGTPVVTGLTQKAAGTGSLAAATAYKVKVSAVTFFGNRQAAKGRVGGAGADAYGETDPSAEMSRTTAASAAGSDSIYFKFTAVPGAVAYNVYMTAAAGASNSEVYNQTVYTNLVVITAAGTSTNTPNVADQTADTNAKWDGFITDFAKRGGRFRSLNGAPFTGDQKTGVAEIDADLKYFFDTYRMGPKTIWVGSDQRVDIDGIVLGSSAPAYRVDLQAGATNITGGISAGYLLNRYMNENVEILTHPFMPSGTLLYETYDLGKYYPSATLPNPIEVMCGWDYYAFEFANMSRRDEFGVYANEAPVIRAPFALGGLQCIGRT